MEAIHDELDCVSIISRATGFKTLTWVRPRAILVNYADATLRHRGCQMPLSDFDVPTKALLGTALDVAWSTLPDLDTWIVNRRVDMMRRLTRQLLKAAEAGERDLAMLVKAALEGVER